MGIIPLFYEKFNLNKFHEYSNPYSSGKETDIMCNFVNFNSFAEKEITKSKDYIFKHTNIVGDVDQQTYNNLEFLIVNNNENDIDVILEKDEE